MHAMTRNVPPHTPQYSMFVRERGARDVAAKAFERVPLMGSAARAAMQRKPRELSDALCQRVGRDGA